MQHWAKVNSLVSSKVSSKVNLETGVSRKQSTPNVPKNKHSPPIRTYTCAYQDVRNVRFSENLACFVFLKHSF